MMLPKQRLAGTQQCFQLRNPLGFPIFTQLKNAMCDFFFQARDTRGFTIAELLALGMADISTAMEIDIFQLLRLDGQRNLHALQLLFYGQAGLQQVIIAVMVMQ